MWWSLIRVFFLGYPTVVQTNILIRSMGPVSELDMVSKHCNLYVTQMKNVVSIVDYEAHLAV